MASLDTAFQTAVFAALQIALPGVSKGAHRPKDVALPYVEFGQSEVSDNHPPGHELLLILHVWSNKEGPHQVKDYQDKIRDALHANSFSRDGWNFACVREQFCDCIIDPDDETWHGIQRFRALAELE